MPHFLPRLSVEALAGKMDNLIGIGPFLDADEAAEVSLTLMIAIQGDDKDLAQRVRLRLFSEYEKMTVESRAEVRKIVESFMDADILTRLQQREAKIRPGPQAEGSGG